MMPSSKPGIIRPEPETSLKSSAAPPSNFSPSIVPSKSKSHVFFRHALVSVQTLLLQVFNHYINVFASLISDDTFNSRSSTGFHFNFWINFNSRFKTKASSLFSTFSMFGMPTALIFLVELLRILCRR